MKTIWLTLATSGLILMLLPSILVFRGVIRLDDSHRVMLVGACLWIISRWGLDRIKRAEGSDH